MYIVELLLGNKKMVEEQESNVEDVSNVKSNLENYVSYFNPKRGYGFFLESSSEKQIFFHFSDVENFKELGEKINLFDTVVSYELGKSPRDDREKAFNIILKRKVVDQEEEEESEEMVSDG